MLKFVNRTPSKVKTWKELEDGHTYLNYAGSPAFVARSIAGIRYLIYLETGLMFHINDLDPNETFTEVEMEVTIL
jgi:hypothetical protein